MPQLKSRLDTGSDAFRANAEHLKALTADLRAQVSKVAEGGGPFGANGDPGSAG